MMIGLPAMVYPSGSKASRPDRLPFLEDPDQGPEAGADRQQGHDHGLERDDHRAEEQEQDHGARDQRQPDGEGRPLALRHEEVVTGRRTATDLGGDAVPGVDRADDRDHVGRGGLRWRQGTDGVESDGRAVDVARQQRVEAGRTLVRGQGEQTRDLFGGQLRAGLRVADRERAFDPVDPVEAVDGRGERRDRGDVLGRGRIARHVREDDDRGRLAGRELGLERDVGVAALDPGRVDLSARHALLESQERGAGDEQDGERRDQHGEGAAHDGMRDALPA